MAQLMGEDRLQLRRRQVLLDASGQQNDGAQESDDAGLQEAGGAANLDGRRDIRRQAGAEGGADANPAAKSDYPNGQESARPRAEEGDRPPIASRGHGRR